MIYCKKCVQPNTRPGIVFTDGVCSACNLAAQSVDWKQRMHELEEITAYAKAQNKVYDCVIGVSGGKDSHFQALYVKENLGLRALLVNCTPDHITQVGKDNLENLVSYGFDMISIRPNPLVLRQLTKICFYKYGNPVKPSEYPLYASAWKIANYFDIPLIIQGENPAITLGIIDDIDVGGDATLIWQHDTVSTDLGMLIDNQRDLNLYQLSSELLDVKAIFLSYYVKEWSFNGNTEFAVKRGLKGRFPHDPDKTGRLNPYCSVDDDMQIVNQMMKYYKFGFGFTTDEVCYSIREGRLSRKEAIKLVEQYDGKYDTRYIREFCDYIDISKKEFWRVIDKWVNKDLFEKEASKWKPKFKVGG